MAETINDVKEAEDTAAVPEEQTESLSDDEVIDYITGARVKLRGSEEVRQRVARALFHEYGISVEDMARDFPIPVQTEGGRKRVRKADIAIFVPEAEHTLDNLRRVVICKAEPKAGRAVTKMRTYEQADKDLNELRDLLGTESTPKAEYGMWTNGLDFFFLHKKSSKLGATFEYQANWPLGDETPVNGSVASVARLRRGETAMLKTAFRRCHNYVHGNDGMPKDAAFWQFLYLLFTKMHDERVSRRERRPERFYVLPDEPFTEEGREKIRSRILRLFEEVKREYPLFNESDVIRLSPRALAFIVGELAPYDLSGTDMDVKGVAYQELVGGNLRGDRGQYFTPRGAVELMVKMLDPKEDERVFDPACGTGGFLRETLKQQLNRWREEEGTLGLPDTEAQLVDHQMRLAEYAENNLFGADFDQFLVRATSMSIMTFTGGEGNVYHMNSLQFPEGDYPGVPDAIDAAPLGSIDVLMTNPPFGTDIKVEDADILDHYRQGVARSWTRDKETGDIVAGDRDITAMAPEQLFIQRAVEWVKPGGRIGIVLPNGILSNPGPTDEAIRRWILDNCWILASVELPVETFIVDAEVNILTTLLFLKKKTEDEKMAANMADREEDYPVFMAVAEKVGVDRRGKVIYKRHPDGSPVMKEEREVERIYRRTGPVERTLVRRQKVSDNDLPLIAEAYRRFRKTHPEPGVAK